MCPSKARRARDAGLQRKQQNPGREKISRAKQESVNLRRQNELSLVLALMWVGCMYRCPSIGCMNRCSSITERQDANVRVRLLKCLRLQNGVPSPLCIQPTQRLTCHAKPPPKNHEKNMNPVTIRSEKAKQSFATLWVTAMRYAYRCFLQ